MKSDDINYEIDEGGDEEVVCSWKIHFGVPMPNSFYNDNYI